MKEGLGGEEGLESAGDRLQEALGEATGVDCLVSAASEL